MSDGTPFLYAAIVVPPLVLISLTFPARGLGNLRVAVLLAALASFFAAAALFALGWSRDVSGQPLDRVVVAGPWGDALLQLNRLNLPLFPLVAAVWLAGLAVAPARSFTRSAVRRSAASYSVLVAAFSTESPQLLVLLVITGCVLFVLEHRSVPRVARVAALYLSASGVALVAGAILLGLGIGENFAIWLVVGGVFVRGGLIPVHSWVPDSLEFGHLVPGLLFHTPQLGAYVVAVVVLPADQAGTLAAVCVLALATALYGAVLAVAECDTRRAFGYLFMSQSAIVLAGIASGDAGGVAGGLAVWCASGLSLAGLGLAVSALELRRGRLSLADRHGGYEQVPLLGLSFLVLGLASVGFPGTLGFLGMELLVGGTVARFPAIGLVGVAVTALSSVTIMKMYFSLFCGRSLRVLPLVLRPRELAVFACLAALVVAGGLVPRYLVESRLQAAKTLLSPTDGGGAAPSRPLETLVH